MEVDRQSATLNPLHDEGTGILFLAGRVSLRAHLTHTVRLGRWKHSFGGDFRWRYSDAVQLSLQ